MFVFFGLVATAGTTYAAIEDVTGLSIVMGCAAGSLACALLVVNNLRDIPTDREVGKMTLAVRLGDRRTRWFYIALVNVAFIVVVVAAFWRVPVLLALVAAPLAFAPGKAVLRGASGRDLIGVLGATGRLQLAFGLASRRSASSSAPESSQCDDDVGGGCGALEVDAVPGAVDLLEPGVRGSCRAAAADLAELRVVLSGEDQRRHVDVAEAVPQRFLRAGAGRAQARGETRRCVAQAVGTLVLRRCQSGEQRIGQPLVDECLDTDRLDVRRQCLVGRSPRRPLVVVVDPGRRTDQDQPLDELRVGERGMQRHSAAHRVADVRRSPTDVHEVVGALPQVGPTSRRRSRARACRRRRRRRSGGGRRADRRTSPTRPPSG